MASAVASEYIGSRIYVRTWDHDPGSTNAILASPDGGTTIRYVDLKDFFNVAVCASPTVIGGDGLTKVELVASTATTFSSVTVIKDSGTIAGNALDDQGFLECNAEEVKHLGADLRYVAARLTMGTNTDEAKVTYICTRKGFETTGMSATTIT